MVMKILVAEDDEDQLFVRCMLLRESGFEPIPAPDLAAALNLSAAQKPECAIVDLRMPTEDDGFHLIRHLKAADPAIRIIVLTGAASGRLDSPLIDGVIVKGSPTSVLLQKLREIEQIRALPSVEPPRRSP